MHGFLKDLNFNKETIMLKMQKDFSVYIQYKFLNIFKKQFKKEDKIAVLDDTDFYEIKQLMNFGYDIEILVLDRINDLASFGYDYLIFRNRVEFSNNIEYFNTKNSKLKCEYYLKQYGNNFYPISKKCFFDENFLNNLGFYYAETIDIENKKFYIYKNLKKETAQKSVNN